MRLTRWLLPQGQFLEIEGADRFVPMSKLEETAEGVRLFLEGHEREVRQLTNERFCAII